MANVISITQRVPAHALLPTYTRNDIEALVERLIRVLDEIDGDCDLEPNLGWVTHWNGIIDGITDTDECEVDDDREVDHDFY